MTNKVDPNFPKIELNPPKLKCEVGIEFEVEGSEIPTMKRILDMLGVNSRTFPFRNVRVVKI